MPANPDSIDIASSRAAIRKVAIASFVGTTIEWYDFFLYGTASALIFNRVFFPGDDPMIGTLKSFGVYAVGFVARPIGGIVCGHYGDKIGRKSMLVLTLLVMGIATFLIGLLPSYAQIGVWAPILLVVLRLAQGFGVGGEWGGAVLMAVEHSPPNRRGFYGSWPQMGVPAGLLLSNLIFRQTARLDDEALFSWGWRLPFLLSIVMIAVGVFIRLAVEEPAIFTKIKKASEESKTPILQVIREHPKNLLLAMGARVADNGVFYVYTVFILTYATRAEVGFTRDALLGAISIAAAFAIFTIPAFGLLSDFVGRRPVYLAGTILTGLFAFPFFRLVDTSNGAMMTFAIAFAIAVGHALMYGPQASFFSELFGTRVRYTGASLGYQLSSVFAGGFSPLIAAALLKATGASWPISLYIIGLSLISAVSVYLARETAHIDLTAEFVRPSSEDQLSPVVAADVPRVNPGEGTRDPK